MAKKTTLDQMLKKADAIGDYYSYLQQQTFYLLIDAFKSSRPHLVEENDSKSLLEWRLRALSKMGALTKQVIALISKSTGKSKHDIYELIHDDGLSVAKQINHHLAKSLHKPLKSVSQDTMQIIDSYANQTFHDVNNYVNQTLLDTNYNRNPALKTYQQIIDKTVLQVSTGLKTTQQALKDNIYQWYDQGLKSSFVDKGGHTWSVEGYTRTVINSTTSRVFNDVRMQSMKEFNTVLATMSTHACARPACAPIQGKVVNTVPKSDPRFNKKYPTIYDHDYGKPAGTLGINCRHMLYPYVEGISHNFQKQVDPKEAIENGKVEAKQRYYERQVRNLKYKKLLAQRIGDSSSATKFQHQISGYQARLRNIVKQNKFLARQYNREKIYPNMAEIDRKAAKIRLTVNRDKQARHILGTPEYKAALKNRESAPSYFTVSPKELDAIIQERVDKGKAFQNHQYVKAEKIIGVYEDESGNAVKTTRMKIMQSKNGYHAVPAPPKSQEKKK
jgi:hypothetical protein